MQITSISPSQAAINVSLTENIIVTFDKNIDTDSVDNASITVSTKRKNILQVGLSYTGQPTGVFDTDNFFEEELTGIADGNISVADNVITFTPSERYSPETLYTIYVSTAILDIDGGSLEKIITSSFTTRAQDMEEPLPITYDTTSIIGNNIVFTEIETNDTNAQFYVESTSPQADSFLIISPNISIQMNKDIGSDQTDKISVFKYELLSDYPPVELTSEQYTLTIDDNIISVTLNEEVIATNSIFQVKINKTFMSVDDEGLASDYSFSYITLLDPYYTSTKIMRLKAGSLLNGVDDITLALNIHYSSLEANNLIKPGVNSNIKNKYTLYNALHMTLLNSTANSTSDYIKKQLSEFSITISNKSEVNTYNKLLSEIENWKRTFSSYINFAASAGAFRRGSSTRDIGRMWATNGPGLNTKIYNDDRFVMLWDDMYEEYDPYVS